jgi:quercetin dioxygenase-like cupin family protein
MEVHMTTQILENLDRGSVETELEGALQPAAGAMGSMNKSQQELVRHVPAGTGPAYWGPGERMTFLATGKETSGAFFLAEIEVAPGGGAPPHIHRREDEAFHMLQGSLTIQVGGNTITASAGDFAFLPRGIAHSFRNTSDGCAKALVLTTPAGLEGFFAEVFDPATDHLATPPPQSKDLITRALAAAPKYGLELLPPA